MIKHLWIIRPFSLEQGIKRKGEDKRPQTNTHLLQLDSNCDGRRGRLSCSSLYSNLRKTPHVGGKHGSGSGHMLTRAPGHKTGRQAGSPGGFCGGGNGRHLSDLSVTLQLGKSKPSPFMMSRLYELCLFFLPAIFLSSSDPHVVKHRRKQLTTC